MATPQKRTSKTITGFAATRGRRDIIKQAASDLERGLEDTDQRSPVTPRRRRQKKR